MNMPKPGQEQNNNQPKEFKPPMGCGSFILPLFLLGLVLYFFIPQNRGEEIQLSDFEDLVKEGKVERVEIINRESGEVYLKDDLMVEETETTDYLNSSKGPKYNINIGTPEVFEARLDRLEEGLPADQKIKVEYSSRQNWGNILIWILPLIIIFALFMFLTRGLRGAGGSNMFSSFGKSNARLFESDKKIQVCLKDVAGIDEAKQEIHEIIDFLKNPDFYTKLGAKIPKGVILVGPPGTGKTLLAKAVAGEAKVPFFSLSGSEFVEMFVGVGASRVRDLFKKAKEKSPCIIFIDEIDAIGRSRGKQQPMGGNDERENTLNQLLTEMDGFSSNSGVIVMAATNRGEILDRALLRPGRFDRHIYLELPDQRERKEIFKVHMKRLVLEDNIDVDVIAAQTPGFSGADIANVCNEAALVAARRKKTKIGEDEFSEALDRIIGGTEKKNKVISPSERKTVAFHEAGHALATYYLKGLKDIVKITIIPRGKSLGAAWYRPEEISLVKVSKLTNEITILLAGRAAEEVMFGEVTSGALDDLERATKQAYSMIVYYGLGEKLGNISYYDSSGNESFQKPYSEETSKMIDEEVRTLVSSCYEKILNLFVENKGELEKVGNLLLEKEIIYKEDLENVLLPINDQ